MWQLLICISIIYITKVNFCVCASCDNNGEGSSTIDSLVCSGDWCSPEKAYEVDTYNNSVLQNITYVKVTKGPLTSCSISNLGKVVVIDGSNGDLEKLDSKTFYNVPNLKYLYLSFNVISRIMDEFVKNEKQTRLEILDLSFNKIVLIKDNAFKWVNPRILNLSRNELTFFTLSKNMDGIEELILSHNFLKEIEFWQLKDSNAFIVLPHSLTVLDLSFNRLTRLSQLQCSDERSTRCLLKKVDLNYNMLSYMQPNEVQIEEIRLGFNQFDSYTPLLKQIRSRVRAIQLYPNPWACGDWMRMYLTTPVADENLLSPDSDTRFKMGFDYPICINSIDAIGEYDAIIKSAIKEQGPNCEKDSQCPDDMLCRTNQCINPCNYNACRGTGETCRTELYAISCSCPNRQSTQPFDYFSQCYQIECFLDSQCGEDERCIKQVCEVI